MSIVRDGKLYEVSFHNHSQMMYVWIPSQLSRHFVNIITGVTESDDWQADEIEFPYEYMIREGKENFLEAYPHHKEYVK